MGKFNEIQEEVKQSFGSNSFTTTVKENTVEFDSAKDSFTFKDPIEVPGITVNGQPISGGGADWDAKEGEAGYIENKPFYERISPEIKASQGVGEYTIMFESIGIEGVYSKIDKVINLYDYVDAEYQYIIGGESESGYVSYSDIIDLGIGVFYLTDNAFIISVENDNTDVFGTILNKGTYITKKFGEYTFDDFVLKSNVFIKKIENKYVENLPSTYLFNEENKFGFQDVVTDAYGSQITIDFNNDFEDDDEIIQICEYRGVQKFNTTHPVFQYRTEDGDPVNFTKYYSNIDTTENNGIYMWQAYVEKRYDEYILFINLTKLIEH